MERVANHPNVARAIRRSRNARSAMQRRRRRLVAGVGAAILCGSGALFSFAGLTSGDAVAAAVNQAQSLAQLIDQRSPGARVAGAQTKHKRVQHALAKMRGKPAPAAPSAAMLAKILMPESPVGSASAVPSALQGVAPVPTLAQLVLPPAGGPGVVGQPGGSTPGGGTPGGGTPGGGNPGTGTPGGGSPPMVYTPHDEKVVAAVPEPGTWALMLLGFGLIGWRTRRTRRGQLKLA